jgi:5-methylcytosine-specific restriction endonuclease McrA
MREHRAGAAVAAAAPEARAMITAEQHYCIFCVLDGVPPPADPAADEQRRLRDQRSASVHAAAEARAAEAERLRREAEAREAEAATVEGRRRQARRLAEQRRREREAAAPGSATEEQLAARWAFYGGRCWMCQGVATTMDHVKPLASGGSQWPSNQRPACWPCNVRKGAHWPWPIRRSGATAA